MDKGSIQAHQEGVEEYPDLASIWWSTKAHSCGKSRAAEPASIGFEGNNDWLQRLSPLAADEFVGNLPDGTPVLTTRKWTATLENRVVILEVEGGSDKGPDGHRRDTLALVEALVSRGWQAEVLFYRDDSSYALLEYVTRTADAFISRINPGCYATYTEKTYFEMCRTLNLRGITAMNHPDVMLNYGAKDALVKLAHTPAGLPDTYAYYTLEALRAGFPHSLAHSDRVLKQNRGSTGSGIWVVRPHGWARDLLAAGEAVGEDALVLCTEMVDNHSEVHRLGDFMAFCEQYTVGDGGQLVDQRFLPRIVEGEIRVLMIGDQPASVVHKKPAEGALSATLFSGAQYTYDPPSSPRWAGLLDTWLGSLPQLRSVLGGHLELPLIWTADFILDSAPDGSDAYRLGELNCSCVGFTTELELADPIADCAIEMIHKARAGSLVLAAEEENVLDFGNGQEFGPQALPVYGTCEAALGDGCLGGAEFELRAAESEQPSEVSAVLQVAVMAAS